MKVTLFLAFIVNFRFQASASAFFSVSSPVVDLDYGSFQGIQDGALLKFLGMPFAAPPIGNRRFSPPESPHEFDGVHQATSYGAACPQQAANCSLPSNLTLPANISAIFSGNSNLTTSEDCLFINVITPKYSTGYRKLPVVFWIFGGGFELGDTSYNKGDSIVLRSISLNEPVIYVSANYRMNAFGFLGGKEALENGAANAGLKDQRFALKWVQKYIHLFGGDPGKVTIWGQSAGSYSVALHLIINDGDNEGLFHAAVLESGSISLLTSTTEDQQPVYDQLVSDTGCNLSNDTFACLRSTSFDNLMTAINKTPNLFSYYGLKLFYQPTIDGDLITRGPAISIRKGLYSKVPIIHGDVDDEGTFFAIASLNVTTNDQFGDLVSNIFLPGITEEQLDTVMNAYPSDVTKGSPFDTGYDNAISPQFKRIAAFLGDLYFKAPRRFLMHATSKTQPTYGYLYKREKRTSFLGSFHDSDIRDFYGSSGDSFAVDSLIHFFNTFDPNSNSTPSIFWPPYKSSFSGPLLLTYFDQVPSVGITMDDYRESPINVLMDISMRLSELCG